MVPSLSYNGDIIIESGIVAQFLADAYPSALLPASNATGGARQRAHINFFTETFFSKVHSVFSKLYSSKTEEDVESIAQAGITAVEKELEPLLKDANPFFAGSLQLTLAEVSLIHVART